MSTERLTERVYTMGKQFLYLQCTVGKKIFVMLFLLRIYVSETSTVEH
jgi:hypothetical protein